MPKGQCFQILIYGFVRLDTFCRASKSTSATAARLRREESLTFQQRAGSRGHHWRNRRASGDIKLFNSHFELTIFTP
jgi:hypothetical protein